MGELVGGQALPFFDLHPKKFADDIDLEAGPRSRRVSTPTLEPSLCNAARLRDLEARESAVQGSRRSGLECLPLSWGSRRRTEAKRNGMYRHGLYYEGGH
jgi:hypothetical protein